MDSKRLIFFYDNICRPSGNAALLLDEAVQEEMGILRQLKSSKRFLKRKRMRLRSLTYPEGDALSSPFFGNDLTHLLSGF